MEAQGQPLFSIITPVYNSGRARLQQTLESVLAQDPALFEHLIVDGGSTDDTLAAVAPCRDRVRLISERDRGIYDAMNKGIAAARGRYVYFIGAGDRLRPGVLAQVRDRLPPGALNFVYGDTNMLDRDAPRYDGAFDPSKLRQRNICHQSIFYGREIFDELGSFDLKYTILSDYAFNLRCFGSDRVRKVHVDLVIADYEGDGISSRKYDQAFLLDKAGLILRHLGPRQLVLHGIDLARGALTIGRREVGSLREQPRGLRFVLRQGMASRLRELVFETLQR